MSINVLSCIHIANCAATQDYARRRAVSYSTDISSFILNTCKKTTTTCVKQLLPLLTISVPWRKLIVCWRRRFFGALRLRTSPQIGWTSAAGARAIRLYATFSSIPLNVNWAVWLLNEIDWTTRCATKCKRFSAYVNLFGCDMWTQL